MEAAPIEVLSWTLSAHLGCALLVTLFFSALVAALERVELRLWLLAWSAETLAAFCGVLFAFEGGGVEGLELDWRWRFVVFVYCVSKTVFALSLVRGLRRHFRPKEVLRVGLWQLLSFSLFWGLLVALVVPRVLIVLPLQWLLASLVLVVGGFDVLRSNPRRGSHLAPALVVAVGVLYLFYFSVSVPVLWGGEVLVPIWNYAPGLDAIAVVTLALVLMVAIERTRNANLEEVTLRLQDSHENLQKLAEVDALTGLTHRAHLRDTLDRVGEAAILSVDLDDFSDINETYGHDIGDVCLNWTAGTLARAFRPSDHLFRMGSDEFLVVAPGCTAEIARQRVEAVRVIVRQGTAIRPPVELSYGLAMLEAGSAPADVLRQVGELLKQRKETRRADAG